MSLSVDWNACDWKVKLFIIDPKQKHQSFDQNRSNLLKPGNSLIEQLHYQSSGFEIPLLLQTISRSQKPQSCYRKAWSRFRSTRPRRRGRRVDAGGCFVSETRNTGWTWRPLNLTRGLSAMEVSGSTLWYWHYLTQIDLIVLLLL